MLLANPVERGPGHEQAGNSMAAVPSACSRWAMQGPLCMQRQVVCHPPLAAHRLQGGGRWCVIRRWLHIGCRGVALEALGRFDEAVADYRAVLAAAPEDPSAWNNLGNAYAGAGGRGD